MRECRISIIYENTIGRKMNYKLYCSAGSCSLAPHIVLEEIGLPYSLAMLSTDQGDTRTAEFYKLNPKGRIPVLVAENFHLTEAPAILIYLATNFPAAKLLDTGSEPLIRSIEWFNWLSGTVHSVAVRMIWRPEYFTENPSQYAEIISKGKAHLLAAFSLIEDRLTQSMWAVGQNYSIVDPYLLVFYRWGNRMKINMRNEYPAWTDHACRLEMRAAVKHALEQEEISLWS